MRPPRRGCGRAADRARRRRPRPCSLSALIRFHGGVAGIVAGAGARGPRPWRIAAPGFFFSFLFFPSGVASAGTAASGCWRHEFTRWCSRLVAAAQLDPLLLPIFPSHQSAKQKLNIISIAPAFLFAFPGDGRTRAVREKQPRDRRSHPPWRWRDAHVHGDKQWQHRPVGYEACPGLVGATRLFGACSCPHHAPNRPELKPTFASCRWVIN